MYGFLEPVGGGEDIPLRKEELTVGRSEKCDITLRFGNISGNHCKLVLYNGYWYVLDNGSTNGTQVNSLRVHDRRIDPDSHVAFARHEYIIRYDPIKNGGNGTVPPDFLENNVLEKSLLERAGLARPSIRSIPTVDKRAEQGATIQELESGEFRIDYSNLTLDDLEFLDHLK
ncbi:MAG: FHA domain-containing protein [Thermoguttaceae bacterium]|nr:FHA domain-containing protein [Thermoguttaceae bacterium]